jgi:hypothetical protein
MPNEVAEAIEEMIQQALHHETTLETRRLVANDERESLNTKLT